MHPLCCISLESTTAGMGDQSPEVTTLSRTRSLPASLAGGGSEGNVGRRTAGSESTVAGVLYKWTNYGKGWRSRWFMLRNGVLSYAKIPRPESLNLFTPPNDDVRFIGQISTNRLSRVENTSSSSSSSASSKRKHSKTVAIVHLKVKKKKGHRF